MEPYRLPKLPFRVSVIGTVLWIIVYLFCSANNNVLRGVDHFIDPIVDLLKFVDIPLTHPFMISHSEAFSDHFLKNLIGSTIYIIIFINFYYFLVVVRDAKEIFSVQRTLETIENGIKKLGRDSSIKGLNNGLIVFLIVCPIFTMLFLNGINGWFIYIVKDKFVVFMIATFFFFLPSIMLIQCYFAVVQLVYVLRLL